VFISAYRRTYSLSEATGISTLPEMVFAVNELTIEHESGFKIGFNTADALRPCATVPDDKTAIKVPQAEKWAQLYGCLMMLMHIHSQFRCRKCVLLFICLLCLCLRPLRSCK
jgi:TIP41-like family